MIRTYLDWIITLPWTVNSEDNLDVAHAREILDRDHYDLEKVKDRILEFLAVRKLKADLHGPILCFVGPPGVGKTSLGHSIAEAMGRKFERISVGGVRDEAEIRGHRRTYVGAMPGIIIRAMRDAGTDNPLFMIDEIDKTGRRLARRSLERAARGARPGAEHHLPRPLHGPAVRPQQGSVHHHGQPAGAHPGAAARPHGDHRPRRLHDRREAAHRQELPGAAADRGQRPQAHAGRRSATRRIVEIISPYTREAGVRNLEREIGTICRKLAREVAEARRQPQRFTVNVKRVHELLGRPRLYAEVKRRTSDAGVATGLAWTPVGGDILFIEATAMPGNGSLTVTGQLGDVMKESAMAAMSYVRTHSRELGLEDDYFQKHDIHVHVPAGAIPKDGPSAGVTMATAIASLVTGTPINSDVAMTGEVTLTGQVLPIGGLKEKTLAAQRAGITTVILPSRNEGDLEDVPEELRKDMRFVPVDRVEQVWEAAMGLKLDGKSAELAEATELLEEATELLEQARRKSRASTAAASNGGPVAPAAKKAAARKAAARKPALKKASAKAAAKRPAAKKPAARKPAAGKTSGERRRRSPKPRRRSPRSPPRRPRPLAAAAAARSKRDRKTKHPTGREPHHASWLPACCRVALRRLRCS